MILYTIYDNNGFFWCEYHETKPINSTIKLYKDNFYKPLYNLTTDSFYEGATIQEIEEAQNQINLELKKQAYEQLKETDWYITRFAETGKPIPNEILEQRQLIRDSI